MPPSPDGPHLIPAYEVHEIGMPAILDRVAEGGRYHLTIDADGLDSSIAPGVAGPALGGINYVQMLRGRLAGVRGMGYSRSSR